MKERLEIEHKIEKLSRATQGESLRSRVLIWTAQIDDHLAEMIKRFLKPPRKSDDDELFRPLAPLESFSARISAAYRLGLIADYDAKAFDMLRKIRNFCAHRVESFFMDKDPIKSWMKEFVEFTCHDPSRWETIGGILCPSTDDDCFAACCLTHLFSLELTLLKLEPTQDKFVHDFLGWNKKNEEDAQPAH